LPATVTRRSSRLLIPSRAFPTRSQADRAVGAPGYFCRGRIRSLSRPMGPHAVLHLTLLLGSLKTSQGWAMGYPQRLVHVAMNRYLILALPSGPRPERAEKQLSAPGEVYPANSVARIAVGSYPAFSPLPVP
jgi:hypothetical protein